MTSAYRRAAVWRAILMFHLAATAWMAGEAYQAFGWVGVVAVLWASSGSLITFTYLAAVYWTEYKRFRAQLVARSAEFPPMPQG